MADRFVIATINDGMSYKRFLLLTESMANNGFFKRVVLASKNEVDVPEDVEIVEYSDDALVYLMKSVDLVVLPRVSERIKGDLERIVSAGMPVVVHVASHHGLVKHMESGHHYQSPEWAIYWINKYYSHWRVREDDRMLSPKKVSEKCEGCEEAKKALRRGRK